MAESPSRWIRRFAHLATLTGIVLLGYGMARGAQEDPNCTTNTCIEIEWQWNCAPANNGIEYVHPDCITCSEPTGRCIDHNDLGNGTCTRSEIIAQQIALVDVTPKCDCEMGIANVQGEGPTTVTFTPNGNNVYNCK